MARSKIIVKRVPGPDGTLDHEVKYYERRFRGNLTPSRRDFLSKFCEKQSWRQSCGCPGDCCGCVFESNWTWYYSKGEVVIKVREKHNY